MLIVSKWLLDYCVQPISLIKSKTVLAKIQSMKKFFQSLLKKKDPSLNDSVSATPQKEQTNAKKTINYFSKIKSIIESKITSKLGKSSAALEEIIGVDITEQEIRLAQLMSNKNNDWVLENFFVTPLQLPEGKKILDNEDLVADTLKGALEKSKINVSNVALAIPVTNAIIRVVEAPLMTDDEIANAIETNSLWENLIQLTDSLDDYSVFHQIISRNNETNKMDILFVASKLEDVKSYTDIIKKAGLNPVIIDVKCFSIKAALDQINQLGKVESDLTTVLEFGIDENYLMILLDNNPIITDIFLRAQDKEILNNPSSSQDDLENLVHRYVSQIKQAITDFETKYEKRIRNIKVISSLEQADSFLGMFRKNLSNVGVSLLDPFEQIKIPEHLKEVIQSNNRSSYSAVLGLAFRKLDVFGYYKFVTAVKNINLLPDRTSMIKQKKMKAISGFAFKGFAGAVIAVYLLLFGLAFWNIFSYGEKIKNYSSVVSEFKKVSKQKAIASKELGLMKKSIQLSKSIKSNKQVSYRILAQIASSVPARVYFDSITYDGGTNIFIKGSASSDQDILKLIENLNQKSLITQASLGNMNLPKGGKAGAAKLKGFTIFCKVKKGIS